MPTSPARIRATSIPVESIGVQLAVVALQRALLGRGGAYRYDGKVFTHFEAQQGLATLGVMSILDDAQGRLWLGGVNGLFRNVGEAFVHVSPVGPWQAGTSAERNRTAR